MALPEQIPTISHDGNGSTETAYPFPFKFFSASEVKLYIDGVASNDAITVTGAGDDAGGDVFTSVPYGPNQRVTLNREVPFSQQTVFVTGGRIREKSLETAFDKLSTQTQELRGNLRATPKAAPGDTPPGGSFKQAPSTTQGQDAEGNLISRTVEQEVDHLGIGPKVDEATAAAQAAGISAAQAAQASASVPGAAFNFSPDDVVAFNFEN